MMKRSLLLVLILTLCLSVSFAYAESEAEFNRGCWVKTASSTTLYKMADASGGIVVGTTTDLSESLVASGSLGAGTYVKITATLGSYDLVSYYGGSGYVKASALTSATAKVKLDDGSTVEVAEAMAKDTNALLAYLNSAYSNKTFTAIKGSDTIHVETKKSSGKTSSKNSKNTKSSSKTSSLPVPNVYYTDEVGDKEQVQLVQLALGMSVVNLNGRQVSVPTSSLTWDTEAKKAKVLAMVSATKSGKAPLLSAAKSSASKLGEVSHGTAVAVLKTGSNYTRVYVNGQVGFIKTSYLKFRANKAIKGLETGYLAYDKSLTGNKEITVRAAGKKNALALGTYRPGTPIVIHKLGKTWSEIDVGGVHCYVLTEYVVRATEVSEVVSVQTTTPDTAPTESLVVTPDQVVSTPADEDEEDDDKFVSVTKKNGGQSIVTGEGATVGYGSYKMNNNYEYDQDYEDEDRFFFDEEY